MDSTCTYFVGADNALEGDDYHCYDDYIITITNNVGQNMGNTFDASDMRIVYTVTVLDPETGNTCWTTMNIEDKLPPTLERPADVVVACSEPTDIGYTGDVSIVDCSPTSTQIDEEIEDFGNAVIRAKSLPALLW
ncbi:MAG: hypothetical protein R2792_01565 [Saprospiraceae bacterium]